MIITQKSQPLSSGYYFIFPPLSFFESSEGHKFNIAKVSMIVLGLHWPIFIEKNFKKLIRQIFCEVYLFLNKYSFLNLQTYN
jgi:hypothetical protein